MRAIFVFAIYIIFKALISSVYAHKILVIHPVYAGSHILALRKIIEELISRGHEIRVIRWKESSQIPVLSSDQITETILSIDNSDGIIPFLTREKQASFEFPDRLMWERGLNPTSVFDGGMDTVAASCYTLLQNEKLLQELRQTDFEMAIVDLIYNECGLALAHHLKLPVVSYWGLSFVSGEIQYTTAFNPPSSIPHLYFPYSDDMNVFQRSLNFLFGVSSHILMQIHFYNTNFHIQKYLPETPHPGVLISNLSGMLINSHWAFDYPKQLPPAFFQIGGFHIRKPKPLPKDIEDFLADAAEGVIVFSLGKNFDAKSLPEEVFEDYFKSFAKLKQKVIVKSNSAPDVVPSNVKILKYIPQADIFAHPKTILFMTHCGLHSVMEAVHYGVKMVAIPIFFDQGNVALRLQELGVAYTLSKTAKESDITQAITKVISDESYEENISRISKIYHDTLEPPLKRSIWLIEHVISTKGANHLKLRTKDLNFVQYFCLDVLFLFVLISVVLIVLILKWKFIVRMLFKRELEIKIKKS